MHRFWVFPLVLGLVGAMYPVLCVAQGLIALMFLKGGSTLSNLNFALIYVSNASSPYGFVVGLLVGVAAAFHDMARHSHSDRDGWQAAGRLLGNVWWLGCYAWLVIAGNLGVVIGLVRIGWVSAAFANYRFSVVFFVSVGIINLMAMVRAAMRTASTDDVLSPRVLRSKWRASTRALS